MSSFEDMVKASGFEDILEYYELVDSADLSTEEKLVAFNHWQVSDGTKDGLLMLSNGQKERGYGEQGQ